MINLRYQFLLALSISLTLICQVSQGQVSARKELAPQDSALLLLGPKVLGEERYQELKAKSAGLSPQEAASAKSFERGKEISKTRGPRMATPQLKIPLDGTFTVSMSRNDDGYSSLIPLPFTFTFYGTPYTSLYINNNGNVTFTTGYGAYTSTGFPTAGIPGMVAPFWADVDTRNTGSGLVYHKIESNRIIIIWDHVGYYSVQIDKLNTFELILSDGTDPLVGIGKNMCFSYDDMQWTTGSASGGSGGFGGVPATVGVNKGDGVQYALIGRFDHAGTDYDGAGGANDGVSYLDNKEYCFDVSAGVGTISGKKFNDLNGDGVRGETEPGLSGWTIRLTGAADQSTTTDGSGNYIFTFLTAGTYTVSEVQQAGWTQTAPPSPGTYTVNLAGGQSVTRDFGNFRPTRISGRKFNDFNGNGADDGEPGLYGWTITAVGPVTRSATTDDQGNYSIDLPAGEYIVGEVQQPLWVQTYPAGGVWYLDIGPGDDVADISFGNRFSQQTGRGAITGSVFDDQNGNGRRDTGEPPLSGWRVELNGRGVRRATLTDSNGDYSFTNLSANTYTVQQFLPSDWTQTLPDGGQPYTIAFTSGGRRTGVDFGNRYTPIRSSSIQGTAFDDRNGNGRRDPEDLGIPKRSIELRGGDKSKTVLTDEKGNYVFENVPEGTYTLGQVLPAGAAQTIPVDGGPYTLNLSSGVDRTSLDFGSRIVTGVDEYGEIPTDCKLYQNFPNPFNPGTRISFYLPKSGYVTLGVYNVLGIEVAMLVEGIRTAGTHSVTWNAEDVPSGVYVCRLSADNFVAVRKMVLMK